MAGNQELLSRFGQAMTERMGQPVSLPSAYVQQPGAYTGGGMPFPIGLVAQDPAGANPSLLSRPGMGEFANIFKGLDFGGGSSGVPDGVGRNTPPGGGATGGDSIIPGANIDPDGPLGPGGELGDAFDNFFLPQFDQRTDENRQGTTDGGEPRQGNAAEGSTGPRRRVIGEADGDYGQLVRAKDLIPGDEQAQPGDDFKQAMGAIDLLLQAQGKSASL